MIPWIKNFFTNETAFVGLIRASLLGTGAAVSSGMLDVMTLGVPKWSGVALIALGGFVRAGDKNAKAGG
jgi:hypothetical protein